MIKYITFIYLILIGCSAFGKTLRVAVLDTGINGSYTERTLCPDGHFDFTTGESTVGYDRVSHGTRILKVIDDQQTSLTGYCYLIYKVGQAKPEARFILRALRKAKQAGATLFDLSYAEFKLGITPEQQFFADNPGLVFVVAAGNRAQLLTCGSPCRRLNNVAVVGAIDPDTGEQAWYSNWGPAVNMSFPVRGGTDFAAAVATGKIMHDALAIRRSK